MSPRLSGREKLKRLLECFGREDRVLVPIVADPDSLWPRPWPCGGCCGARPPG